jgi:hypothetical protein
MIAWIKRVVFKLILNSFLKEVNNVKSGIKTTEFWFSLFGALSSMIGQYQGVIPEPWGTIAVAVISATYTIARALTKKSAPSPAPAPEAEAVK